MESNFNSCMCCGMDVYDNAFCFDCNKIMQDPNKDMEQEYNKTKLNVNTMTIEERTRLLETELKATTDAAHINYEYVRSLLKNGVNLEHRNYQGYTLNELAGIRQRYDIADLIYRATYMEI